MKVDPARDRTFDEVKDQVEKQWRAEAVAKALSAKADDMVKQIEGGATLASLAQGAGLEAKSAADLRRSGGAGLAPSLVNAVFTVPAGGAGSAATPDGRVVFKVTADATPPTKFDDPAVKTIASPAHRRAADQRRRAVRQRARNRTRREDPPERPAIGGGRLRPTR